MKTLNLIRARGSRRGIFAPLALLAGILGMASSAFAQGSTEALVSDAVTKVGGVFSTVSPLLLGLLTVAVAFVVYYIVRKGIKGAKP